MRLQVQGGTAGVTLPAHLQAAVKGSTTPGNSGKAELSWLMRTTYISNDVAERRQQGVTEKRAKAIRQAQMEEAPSDSREAQMDAIEVSPGLSLCPFPLLVCCDHPMFPLRFFYTSLSA